MMRNADVCSGCRGICKCKVYELCQVRLGFMEDNFFGVPITIGLGVCLGSGTDLPTSESKSCGVQVASGAIAASY